MFKRIEYYLRIGETLQEAFVERICGFATISLLPGLVGLAKATGQGVPLTGTYFFVLYNLFWLIVIRCTLEKRTEKTKR